MTEKKQMRNAMLKLGAVVVFAFLYQLGGSDMADKWVRRFLAPGWLVVNMFLWTRDWKVSITFLMMGSLSLGYGATELWAKIIRRLVFGVANGITSSGYNIVKKKYLLSGFQVVLCTVALIILGVWNPLPNARTEELVIGFFIGFIPMMSVKEKE